MMVNGEGARTPPDAKASSATEERTTRMHAASAITDDSSE
jgi:hypothetical protein